MKKKLLGIALLVVLLVGVLVLSASAEGTLGTVMNITINDLDEPVPGELIDFDATPHRENFYEIANNGYCVFWYDETDGGEELLWSENPVYTKGHDYKVRVYVEPKAGYEFAEDPSTMTAFIGDKVANVYKDSNGYFVQLYYDTCGTIENIDIFFEYPSQGEAPSFEKIDTARYYSDGNVSPEVNGVKWYDVTDGKYLISGTGAKFICGHTYKVAFTLRASGDCEFGNAEAYVNGKAAVLDWYNPYMVTVTYTFDKLVCTPEFVEGEFPSCNGTGRVGYYACACGKWYWDEEGTEPIENEEDILIPPTGAHNYEEVVTKATTTASGKIEKKCSCGDVESTETIAKIASVTLSKENYIYDGKNKTPTVTVKDANGKKLTKNVDYKLSVASKRSGIGRYTVKVTFIGNYSGTKNVYFYIKTGKPDSVKSASQTTSSVKLSWSAVPGAAGYTVYRYSPSKKAYVKAGTTEGTSFTVSKLYTGTKYTFRVVSYGKTSAGKVYDSDVYALLKTATKTKTPELTKVTASATKGKAYVYHSDVSGETGYTVYYSTKKDSGFKKYANFKADTTRCDITGLTSGKTYYFKVRTYIKTDSGYVYSAWSAVKSVKVK